MDYDRTVLILKMMANPTRLKILQALLEREKADYETSVGKLEELIDVPQSSVSQHLAHLRNSGILTSNKRGKKVCYALNNKIVEEILSCVVKV